MTSCLQSSIEYIGAAFTEDRIEDIAQFFTTPLPVYREGALVICYKPADIVSCLRAHRLFVMTRGIEKVSGRLIAQSIPRYERVQFWADWYYNFADGRPTRVSSIRYYCSQSKPHFLCNMMEYRTLAFADRPGAELEQMAVGY